MWMKRPVMMTKVMSGFVAVVNGSDVGECTTQESWERKPYECLSSLARTSPIFGHFCFVQPFHVLAGAAVLPTASSIVKYKAARQPNNQWTV